MTKTAAACSSRRDSKDAAEEIADRIFQEMETPHVLIVFVSSRHDYAIVLAILQRRFPKTLIAGCSSAGEFSSTGTTEGGISVFGLLSDEMAFSVSMAENIGSAPEIAAEHLLAGFRGFAEGKYRYRTALVLNDALAGSADELVRALNLQTGGKYKFFGGGAGDDAAFARTYVFLGTKISTNAAVALEILSKKPIGVGIRHGWRPATDLFRVTSALGPAVESLDAIAAADIFAEYAEDTGQTIDKKNPLPFFLHNIAGIKLTGGYKLRVPLSINPEGGVTFAAEVPEGSAVCIMSTDRQSAIDAAREATQEAVRQLGENRASGALIFDCVATRMRLGEDFGNEISTIGQMLRDVPFAGCNTYGQIASAEGQFTGFHNCTAVVCVFPE